MIWVFNVPEPKYLSKIHAVFEHTDPRLQNTFITHFTVGDEEFQYIYIAQLWADVVPKIMEYFQYAAEGIEVIVIVADLMACETPPDIDEYPKF